MISPEITWKLKTTKHYWDTIYRNRSHAMFKQSTATNGTKNSRQSVGTQKIALKWTVIVRGKTGRTDVEVHLSLGDNSTYLVPWNRSQRNKQTECANNHHYESILKRFWCESRTLQRSAIYFLKLKLKSFLIDVLNEKRSSGQRIIVRLDRQTNLSNVERSYTLWMNFEEVAMRFGIHRFQQFLQRCVWPKRAGEWSRTVRL